MISVRLATRADRPAIRDVARAAFGREEEVALVDRIWTSPEYLPDLELVAEEVGSLAGHLMHNIGFVGSRRLVALAPLAVVPTRQGRGIGTALMREGIGRANAAGHPAIVLVGHPQYYTRFGFVPARSMGI